MIENNISYRKIIFIVSFLVVFGFLFNFSAPTTEAMTVTELQTLIQQPQQQISQQLVEIEGRSTAWCHDFKVNLKYEMSGAEVNALQTALEKEGFKIVESEKTPVARFEDFTASAVVGFQQKYREEILSPWGLEHGTGYVGKTTRAKLNELYRCEVKKPYIKVISPNGGENWEVGKTYEIRWTSSLPSSEEVTISLQDIRYDYFSESPLGTVVIAKTPNTGSYSWTISRELTDSLGRKMKLAAGNVYTVAVYTSRPGGKCLLKKCDVSDNLFSIVKVVLKSNYFSSDQTAIDILEGDITNYKFSDLYEEGDITLINVDPNKFQYKIVNALRMLGYSLSETQDKKLLPRWVEAFQKRHNLLISDIITKDFIMRLDEEIFDHENQISTYIDSFPINEDFYDNNLRADVSYEEHHKNEPPKDHVRFFYSYLMSSLPNRIAPLTKDSVSFFFAHQAHGVIYYDLKNSKWKLNYIPSALPLNEQTKGIYKSSKIDPSDSKNVSSFFHEYGHQIDSSIYNYAIPNAGMINTDAFYKILFNMDDCVMCRGWKRCKLKPEAKFVSDYAISWECPENPGYHSISESFAESFAMYILHGKLYRKIATIDSNYQLQYDWLRREVLEGIEYCTGDENMIRWEHPQWDYENNMIPSSVSSISNDAFIPSRVNDNRPIFSLSESVLKLNAPGCTAPPTSSITVLSPNGGERWARDSSQTIRWSSSGFTYVFADLIRDNTVVKRISIGNSALPGALTWKIPSDVSEGSNYKIRLTGSNTFNVYSGIYDESDNYFSIVSGLGLENIKQQLAFISNAISYLIDKIKELLK